MGKDATRPLGLEAILDLALRGDLREADAQQLYTLGPEAVTLVLLATMQRLAELRPTPSAWPSVCPAIALIC